jgi:putative cell wall-binding protein
VVIVGELQDVSQESEDALRQAGCQVQRVQGMPEEIAAALRDV